MVLTRKVFNVFKPAGHLLLLFDLLFLLTEELTTALLGLSVLVERVDFMRKGINKSLARDVNSLSTRCFVACTVRYRRVGFCGFLICTRTAGTRTMV